MTDEALKAEQHLWKFCPSKFDESRTRGLVGALTDRLTAVEAERDQLRQWMWLTHGCAVAMLYGDDGQMQCSACMIDFKAWPVEDVLNRLRQRRAVALGVPLSLSAIAARIHEDESSD